MPRSAKKTRKTREAWGRVRKLPSGRYQAAYTGPDLRLWKGLSTFDTLGDARGWLQRERAAIDAGTWVPPDQRHQHPVMPTFAAYAQVWLVERDLKPSTRQLYRKHLANHFAAIDGVPLDAITSGLVRSWYKSLPADRKTVRAHAYGLLRTILGSAVDEELISVNPCRIRGAGQTKREHQIKIATPGELDALASALPDRYGALVYIGAWCGLRWGELTELRRGDVDLDREVLNVARAVTRVGSEDVIGTPKSSAGVRSVAIPPHIVPAIRAHLREHVEPGDDVLLFPATVDRTRHLSPGGFRKVWAAAAKSVGLDGYHIHDLRHHGATRAAIAGATTAELMRRIGHSTPNMAARYQHALDDRDSEIARKLSQMVDGSGR
jgi:integrase